MISANFIYCKSCPGSLEFWCNRQIESLIQTPTLVLNQEQMMTYFRGAASDSALTNEVMGLLRQSQREVVESTLKSPLQNLGKEAIWG